MISGRSSSQDPDEPFANLMRDAFQEEKGKLASA